MKLAGSNAGKAFHYITTLCLCVLWLATGAAVAGETSADKSSKPVARSEPKKQLRFTDDLWIAENQEDFRRFKTSASGRPYRNVEVDFTTSRFVLAQIWLTNGANSIGDVRAERQDEGYVIRYDTVVRGLGIGTTNMRYALIHAIVPKDGLPIRLETPEEHYGRRVKDRKKSLHRSSK